jgi:hypothetical protein
VPPVGLEPTTCGFPEYQFCWIASFLEKYCWAADSAHAITRRFAPGSIDSQSFSMNKRWVERGFLVPDTPDLKGILCGRSEPPRGSGVAVAVASEFVANEAALGRPCSPPVSRASPFQTELWLTRMCFNWSERAKVSQPDALEHPSTGLAPFWPTDSVRRGRTAVGSGQRIMSPYSAPRGPGQTVS